jgi:predicted dinucleotide-utilizing enzyme
MEKERGITIIGTGNAGKKVAIELAKNNNICNLYSVVDSHFTDLKKPKPFMITNTMLDVPEPFIDTSDIPNYHKHKMTCDKNRKKRKKGR